MSNAHFAWVLLLLAFVASTSLRAEQKLTSFVGSGNAYVEKAVRIANQAETDLANFMRTPRGVNERGIPSEAAQNDLKKELKRAEEQLDLLAKYDTEFVTAVVAILDKLETPSTRFLQAEKDRVAKSLEMVKKTADVKSDTLVVKDPAELALTRIDPFVQHIIHYQVKAASKTSQAGIARVTELLEVCAAKFAIVSAYLKYTEIRALAMPPKGTRGWLEHMAFGAFHEVHANLELDLSITRTLFAELPSPSRGGYYGAAGAAKMKAFVDQFQSAEGEIEDSISSRLWKALGNIQLAFTQIEEYRRLMFPRLKVDEDLKFLQQSVFSVPGADDCISLSGMDGGQPQTLFDRIPCQPKQFKTALNNFISYYDRVAENGAIYYAAQFVTEYQKGDYGKDDDEAFATLQEKIEALADKNSNFTDDLKKQWPTIVQNICAKSDPLPKDRKDWNLRALLENNATGIELFRYLRRIFLGYQVGSEKHGQRYDQTGSFSDFRPSVEAARTIYTNFLRNVEAPLGQKSTLAGTADPLAELESRITTLDARLNSCGPFLKEKKYSDELVGSRPNFGKDAKAEEEKFLAQLKDLREKGLWVRYPIRNAEKPSGKLPEFSSSANGHQKINWFHDAKIGNALTIQTEDKGALAGMAVRLAGDLVLPNVVHTRLLLQDDLGAAGKDLKDYGLTEEPKALAAIQMEHEFHLPTRQLIVEMSKRAFHGMLRRYADETAHPGRGLLTPVKEVYTKAFEQVLAAKAAEEKVEIDNDFRGRVTVLYQDEIKAVGDKVLNDEFDKKFETIRKAFVNDHRLEMGRAAEQIRHWDKAMKELVLEGPKGAPTLIEEGFPAEMIDGIYANAMNDHEYKVWLKSERKIIPKEHPLRAFNHSLVQLVNFLKQKHCDEHKLNFNTLPTGFQLSPEQFLALFHKHGRAYFGSHYFEVFTTERHEKDPMKRLNLVQIYQHALNIYFKRYEYMEYARSYLLYRFPALKLKDAWKTADVTPESYRRVMLAYSENAVSVFNRYQDLGKYDVTPGERDGERIEIPNYDKQVETILTKLIPNLPLMDMLLSRFPMFKSLVCKEMLDRKIDAVKVDLFLASVAGVGSIVALCPALGPVGVGIAVVAIGAAVVASTYRAYWKMIDARHATEWSAAASGQLDYTQDKTNIDYLRQMDNESSLAWAVLATEVAMLAIPAIGRAPTLYKSARGLMSRTYQGVIRIPYNFSPIWVNGWNPLKWTRNPLLIQRAARGTGYSRFAKYLTAKTPLPQPYLPNGLLGDFGKFSWDMVKEFPWGFFKRRWQTSWQGKAGRIAFDIALIAPEAPTLIPLAKSVALEAWNQVWESGEPAAMAHFSNDPIVQRELEDAQQGGFLGERDRMMLVALDNEARLAFDKNTRRKMQQLRQGLNDDEKKNVEEHLTNLEAELVDDERKFREMADRYSNPRSYLATYRLREFRKIKAEFKR